MVLRSIAELDALSVRDSEIDAIIKSGKIPRPELDFSDDHKAIKQLREIVERWGQMTEKEGVQSLTSEYEARDGQKNRLLVFRPSSAEKTVKLPIIIHIHGGGGCIGTPESTARFCQDLALKQNCVVIAPQYRLGPEFKFPYGVNDCADAVRYVADNAAELGGNISAGFVVGGHSFGASSAAAIAFHVKELGISAKITGLYLGAGAFIGSRIPTGYQSQYRSRNDELCVNAPILDNATLQVFLRGYSGDQDSPWYRVCNSQSADAYKQQLRIYFQVCGMEVYRDDSLIFEDIMRANGAETRLDIYPGCPHIFWSVFTPGTISQATKWAQDTQEGFKWLLNSDSNLPKI